MSTTSPITSTNSIYTPTESNPRVPQKTLGQDDFLKLLVTQFTNQDPMEPMKDTQYIAQMAQFTTLEQSKEMATQISNLHSDSQILQANSLIGRTVDLLDSQDATATGTVTAVTVDAGTPKIIVNGQSYDLSNVVTIRPAQQN